MKFLMLWFVASCLNGPTPLDMKDKWHGTWPDEETTKYSMHCAIDKKYGRKIADHVMDVTLLEFDGDREKPPLDGQYDPVKEEICVDDDDELLNESAARHEIFQHRLPHVICLEALEVLGNVTESERGACAWSGINRNHEPFWSLMVYSELTDLYRECRSVILRRRV